jgi:hypothetical protein
MKKCKVMLDEKTILRLDYWKRVSGFSRSALIRMCVNSMFEKAITNVEEKHSIEQTPVNDE